MSTEKRKSLGIRRLKLRGAKVGRNLVASEANYYVESQAPTEQPRGVGHMIQAAMRHSERRATARRQCMAGRHSVRKVWAFRFFLVLLVIVWGLVLLSCFKFGVLESVSSSGVVPLNTEVDDHPLEKKYIWKILFNFFFPTSCNVKENQEIKPCSEVLNLSETECLRSSCCFSSSRTVPCFVPVIDKSTQMIRTFGLSVLSLVVLGWLPLCCCFLCQRRQHAHPFHIKNERILKNLKKQTQKVKQRTEMLGTMEEEDSDEEEKETRELLPH